MMPGVQKPHCDPPHATNASTSASRTVGSRPPTVVTARPATRDAGRHARDPRFAVDQHRAASALALRRAPVLHRDDAELFAQHGEQRLAVGDRDVDLLAVAAELRPDRTHAPPPGRIRGVTPSPLSTSFPRARRRCGAARRMREQGIGQGERDSPKSTFTEIAPGIVSMDLYARPRTATVRVRGAREGGLRVGQAGTRGDRTARKHTDARSYRRPRVRRDSPSSAACTRRWPSSTGRDLAGRARLRRHAARRSCSKSPPRTRPRSPASPRRVPRRRRRARPMGVDPICTHDPVCPLHTVSLDVDHRTRPTDRGDVRDAGALPDPVLRAGARHDAADGRRPTPTASTSCTSRSTRTTRPPT